MKSALKFLFKLFAIKSTLKFFQFFFNEISTGNFFEVDLQAMLARFLRFLRFVRFAEVKAAFLGGGVVGRTNLL
jgi:hypothetical protein